MRPTQSLAVCTLDSSLALDQISIALLKPMRTNYPSTDWEDTSAPRIVVFQASSVRYGAG